MVALVIAALLGIWLGMLYSAIVVLLIGVLVSIFPFATPQTIEIHGIKTSILLARLGSVLTFTLSAFMIYLYFR
jgi:hypothetical protein